MGTRKAAGWQYAGPIVLVAVLGLAGCGIQVTDSDPPAAEVPDPPPVVVTVRFQNFTLDDAVDVEFFATNDILEMLPDELFAPENHISTSIGVAGTGILQPLTADTIELPCTESTTVGTMGGSFVDNETGEPTGLGVARWAQEGPLGLCGATVTFSYSGGDGEYATNIGVVFTPQP